MRRMGKWLAVFVTLTIVAATSSSLRAQTFTTLVSFNGANGQGGSSLVQGADGNLYGTTFAGGANNGGAIFKISPRDTLTTLYSFTGGTDGGGPNSLVQATDGNFYGTAQEGGANANGTIFKITQAGTLTTLYSFTGGTDGGAPGALLQAADGSLYGTTSGINAGQFVGIEPTIFRITVGGTLTTLYRSDATDGSGPLSLVQATDGNFYGVISGQYVDGAIFKMTNGGILTTLYSFCRQGSIPYCPDGDYPLSLVQATDGNFYGTTFFGGVPNAGTIFKITPSGVLTTLYSFSGGSDGFGPSAVLAATDGSFYGITSGGAGPYPYGTIFKFTPGGPVTTLHSFNGLTGPNALLQAADGNFYGTTASGGANNDGTVFRLALGSQSALSINPDGVVNAASGVFSGAIAPGEIVTIKGTGLGPTTGVSFTVDPTTGMVNTMLAGTQVYFGSFAAPITYTSAAQINAIVPYEVAGQSQITMYVQYDGASSAGTALQVVTSVPGVFTFNGTGTGQAIAANQDYSLNGPSNPASKGSYVTIYFTGGGQTSPPGDTGSVTGDVLKWLTQPVSVTVGGVPVMVAFDGAAPTFVDGVNQLNIQLAAGTPSGPTQPLVIKVAGIAPGVVSPSTAMIAVQ